MSFSLPLVFSTPLASCWSEATKDLGKHAVRALLCSQGRVVPDSFAAAQNDKFEPVNLLIQLLVPSPQPIIRRTSE